MPPIVLPKINMSEVVFDGVLADMKQHGVYFTFPFVHWPFLMSAIEKIQDGLESVLKTEKTVRWRHD